MFSVKLLMVGVSNGKIIFYPDGTQQINETDLNAASHVADRLSYINMAACGFILYQNGSPVLHNVLQRFSNKSAHPDVEADLEASKAYHDRSAELLAQATYRNPGHASGSYYGH